MIAAVVDRRGRVAARSRLASIGRDWSEVHESEHAVVARGRGAPRGSTVVAAARLDAAARLRGTSSLLGLDAGASDGVIAARGSLGGRPLYYASIAGGFVACSQMEPLLRAAGGTFSVDADRVAALAAGTHHHDATRTPLSGVSRVAPCEAVRLSPSGVVRAARPRERREPIGTDVSVEDLAAELWSRVVASVRRAAEGARTIAVMVGGGVDSSGLLAAAVALARGAGPREVLAIALDFDALGGDRPYLDDLARELGIVPMRLRPSDAGPFYRGSFVLDAQPYILTIAPMEQLVFRRARERGAEVLLSGYLADEILAGDLRTLAIEALSGSPASALRLAARLRLPWDTTLRERLESFVLRPLLKPLVPRRLLCRVGERQHARDFPWAGERMRRVLSELRSWAADQPPPRTPEERFDRFARSILLADYGDWRGQMESATGLVREDPYADEDVLDLMARVPPRALVHGDLHRGLFRVALRGRVPDSIRLRTDKSCFEPAFAEAAEAGGGFDALGDLWHVRELEGLGVVESAPFRAAMEPLFRDPSSTAECAELWSYATQALACESFARGHRASRSEAA
jgi:asparagine synthase (glutamine-hydrolysing)